MWGDLKFRVVSIPQGSLRSVGGLTADRNLERRNALELRTYLRLVHRRSQTPPLSNESLRIFSTITSRGRRCFSNSADQGELCCDGSPQGVGLVDSPSARQPRTARRRRYA